MKDYKMTMQQTEKLMLQYERIFSAVRLLNADTILEAVRGERQAVSAGQVSSLEPEKAGQRCVDAVLLKALEEKEKKTKLEFRENEVCLVTAEYVEVDGNPCVLELVQYLDDVDAIDFDGNF